jgi:hypothetical protein
MPFSLLPVVLGYNTLTYSAHRMKLLMLYFGACHVKCVCGFYLCVLCLWNGLQVIVCFVMGDTFQCQGLMHCVALQREHLHKETAMKTGSVF